jgi:1-acyl-sn-glycerol-3-phosphate acyltransferase
VLEKVFEVVVRIVVAISAFSFYITNTIFWCTPIFVLSIFKLIPITKLQASIGRVLDTCATGWVTVNYFIQRVFSRMKVHVSGDYDLSDKDWYLVVANHQSWVDIVILQRVFNRKLPFLKFFLKHELIYVPLLGLAWWALDFPFMKRYSKSYLAKRPHLKGKDLETTKKSCEKFKYTPVSIMNFMEGTRYTDKKHDQQNSSFKGLLKPKSGGVGFVLTVMGEQLHKVVDVTIYYPDKIPTFYDFLSGQVKNVFMHVDVHDINSELIGDYSNDKEYKKLIHNWVSDLWKQKEKTLAELKLQSQSQNLN